MRIEHIAIWTKDIDHMRSFYIKYFDLESGAKYTNTCKGYCSYFLSFKDGARLELMHKTTVSHSDRNCSEEYTGFAHLAVSVGSREAVDLLTSRLRSDGYSLLDGPRVTGDGYYESVVLDPENNRIEITS